MRKNILKSFGKLLPSLTFVPFYIFIFSKFNGGVVISTIYLVNLAGFLSLFDFGASIKPLLKTETTIPCNLDVLKIYALQSTMLVTVILLSGITNILPGIEGYFGILLFSFYTLILTLTNRARIVLDLVCENNFDLSFIRGASGFFRWTSISIFLAADFSSFSIMLILLILSEFIFLLIMVKFRQKKAVRPNFDYIVKSNDLKLSWVGNLSYSFLDIYIRNGFLITESVNLFVIFDLISRIMIVLNIFTSLIISKIQQLDVKYDKVRSLVFRHAFRFIFVLIVAFSFLLDAPQAYLVSAFLLSFITMIGFGIGKVKIVYNTKILAALIIIASDLAP